MVNHQEFYFSELSPRPHDTGMVTLANTQNFSEFELHTRAILGIPVKEITLLKNGASAVILANKDNLSVPIFLGLEEASLFPSTDFKIFGKANLTSLQKNGSCAFLWNIREYRKFS